MKTFTNLINQMVEEKRNRSAKTLLEHATGVAGIELPKRVPMGLLKLIKEENDKFSPEKELREEVHYYKGAVDGTYYVDEDGFHHQDPDEARAYLVINKALCAYYRQRRGE